jgi:hypothetical protein
MLEKFELDVETALRDCKSLEYIPELKMKASEIYDLQRRAERWKKDFCPLLGD